MLHFSANSPAAVPFVPPTDAAASDPAVHSTPTDTAPETPAGILALPPAAEEYADTAFAEPEASTVEASPTIRLPGSKSLWRQYQEAQNRLAEAGAGTDATALRLRLADGENGLDTVRVYQDQTRRQTVFCHLDGKTGQTAWTDTLTWRADEDEGEDVLEFRRSHGQHLAAEPTDPQYPVRLLGAAAHAPEAKSHQNGSPDLYDARLERHEVQAFSFSGDRDFWRDYHRLVNRFRSAASDADGEAFHFLFDGRDVLSLEFCVAHDPIAGRTAFKHVCYEHPNDISTGFLVTDVLTLNAEGNGVDFRRLLSRSGPRLDTVDDAHIRRLMERASEQLHETDTTIRTTVPVPFTCMLGFAPRTVIPVAWKNLQ